MKMPVDWQAFLLLPELDRAHFAPQVRGNFLPRIQPVAGGPRRKKRVQARIDVCAHASPQTTPQQRRESIHSSNGRCFRAQNMFSYYFACRSTRPQLALNVAVARWVVSAFEFQLFLMRSVARLCSRS